MSAIASHVTEFSQDTEDRLDVLRSMLSQDLGWPVELSFPRLHTAEFGITAIPEGSVATPGAIGIVVLSDDGTYAVQDSYADLVLADLSIAQALRLARYVCIQGAMSHFDSEGGRRLWVPDEERAAHGYGRAEDDDADGFNEDVRGRLEFMRSRMSRELDWPVQLHYGASSDEPSAQYALFTVESMPDGERGPFPLLSVLIGGQVQGYAAIVGADPSADTLHVAQEAADFSHDAALIELIHEVATAEFQGVAA